MAPGLQRTCESVEFDYIPVTFCIGPQFGSSREVG